MAAGILNVYW